MNTLILPIKVVTSAAAMLLSILMIILCMAALPVFFTIFVLKDLRKKAQNVTS